MEAKKININGGWEILRRGFGDCWDSGWVAMCGDSAEEIKLITDYRKRVKKNIYVYLIGK